MNKLLIIVLLLLIPYYVSADNEEHNYSNPNPNQHEGHNLKSIDLKYGDYEEFYYHKTCIEIFAQSKRKFSAYLIKSNETIDYKENTYSCNLKHNHLSNHKHHYTYILMNNNAEFEDIITIDFEHHDCDKQVNKDKTAQIAPIFTFLGLIVLALLTLILFFLCIGCYTCCACISNNMDDIGDEDDIINSNSNNNSNSESIFGDITDLEEGGPNNKYNEMKEF